MERNQSSEERHFGVMKRRQSFRPHLNESSLLQEEQLKQFGKYPDCFEMLGYENKDAKVLLEEHIERFKRIEDDQEDDDQEDDDREDDDREDDVHEDDVLDDVLEDDVVQEINNLLKERDFLDEEEEDFSDDDTEW